MRGHTGRSSAARTGGDPGPGRGRRLAEVALLGAVVLALGLAGCSAGKSSGKNAPQSDTAANRDQAAPQGGDAAAGAAGAAGKPAAAPGQVLDPKQVPGDEQRDIVYTGTITVRVSNVDEAANRLAALTTGAGGYVSADARSIDAERSSATVAVRVPAAKFDGTVAAISQLGKELNRQINAEDITAQLVDLDSRVKTQQASVDRIRALLAQAQSVAEIAAVESELTRREADLESLKAQLAALSGQATLSTITVTLLGPEAAKPTTKEKKTGFLHGLSSGWNTFVASVNVLVTVIGALLPFAIAIGVPLWLVLVFVRRRRGRRLADPAIPGPVTVSRPRPTGSTGPAPAGGAQPARSPGAPPAGPAPQPGSEQGPLPPAPPAP